MPIEVKELLQLHPPGVEFRAGARLADDAPQLLREYIGLANGEFEGPRGIVFGAECGQDGHLYVFGVEDQPFSEIQALHSLLAEAIEPQPEFDLRTSEIGGRRVAALLINSFGDPPYIAGEHAPSPMRRGECWVKEGTCLREAHRSDFDRMYAGKASSGSRQVQVGIGDDPTRTVLEVDVPAPGPMPSEKAMAKLREAIAARKAAAAMMGRDDSRLARLDHARIYGTDVPYEQRDVSTLVQALGSAREDYREADLHCRFETRAVQLNFAIRNQSEEALPGAAFEATLPLAAGIAVASRLYSWPDGDSGAGDGRGDGYPEVRTERDCIRVRASLGSLPAGAVVPAFENALRLSIDPRLRGQKMAVRYSLVAQRLDTPIRGRLKLKFRR
jgi:hypothetical protein